MRTGARMALNWEAALTNQVHIEFIANVSFLHSVATSDLNNDDDYCSSVLQTDKR